MCAGTSWAGEHVTTLSYLWRVTSGDLDGDGSDDDVIAIDPGAKGRRCRSGGARVSFFIVS